MNDNPKANLLYLVAADVVALTAVYAISERPVAVLLFGLFFLFRDSYQRIIRDIAKEEAGEAL